MTAEIAILNKYAVALAADSAVTISVGNKSEKIFDTADKLFELSRKNPIGVMIYNGMDFVQIPFQTIICEFRNFGNSYRNINEAADHFLNYLNATGIKAPERVKDGEWMSALEPLISDINTQRSKEFDAYIENIPENDTIEDVRATIDAIPSKIIAGRIEKFRLYKDAEFVGEGSITFTSEFNNKLRSFVERSLEFAKEDQIVEMIELAKLYLSKNVTSDYCTGIVIAGFGFGEIFPTLVSFEIDGMVCDRLKFVRTNIVDIDRNGKRAAVIPFAQKEMVERFLYGLDGDIEKDIVEFCEKSVTEIRSAMMGRIEMPTDADREELESQARVAEIAFVSALKERAFRRLRRRSEEEIEMMVEFMPKPELSKMAEALVNLTSIKRKVSRGFETVGGPIDVVVISQTEGFIWIKRKHYFDPALNVRYIERVKVDTIHAEESSDAAISQARPLAEHGSTD
jgi:hypothetical protein